MNRSLHRPLALAALALLAGCRAAPRPERLDPPAAAPSLAARDDAARLAQVEAGQQLFQATCTACHGEDPPPRTAPPMRHVARRYRAATGDRAEAEARIAAYVRAPAAERSLLPGAVRRWGVMPALPLPDEQLRAVAAYVWTLGDDDGGGHRGRMRGGRP